MRRMFSMLATRKATSICPRLECTVVFGSVIIKKINSWYIGPVMGATSDRKRAENGAASCDSAPRKAA